MSYPFCRGSDKCFRSNSVGRTCWHPVCELSAQQPISLISVILKLEVTVEVGKGQICILSSYEQNQNSITSSLYKVHHPPSFLELNHFFACALFFLVEKRMTNQSWWIGLCLTSRGFGDYSTSTVDSCFSELLKQICY